jgi:dipeptidyl aminopeptidase/acylaminoacyl peptidase
MKHPFITLGSIGGALILGGFAWVYFFLYYEPEPENTRIAENPFVEVEVGSFGTQEGVDGEVQEPDTGAPSAITAVTGRRVAGAVGLGGNRYRFVEAGTGHAYEVSNGSVEQKISNTTYLQAHDAVWSPTGSHVAVSYEVDGVMHTAIEHISDTEVVGASSTEKEIVGTIHSLSWSADGLTLRFVRETAKGSDGIAFDPVKKTEKVLFQTPLREVVVTWDPTPLIVTRAARSLTGYAYRSDLTRESNGIPALTVSARGDVLLFAGLVDSSLTSWFTTNDVVTSLETAVIPEKCTLVDTGAICATPKQFDPSRYPDEWYRGEEIYDDEVRFIDGDTGTARAIGDLSTPFRTPLDIVRTEPSQEGALMLSRGGHLLHVALQ